jgi:hypothetical protein
MVGDSAVVVDILMSEGDNPARTVQEQPGHPDAATMLIDTRVRNRGGLA